MRNLLSVDIGSPQFMVGMDTVDRCQGMVVSKVKQHNRKSEIRVALYWKFGPDLGWKILFPFLKLYIELTD